MNTGIINQITDAVSDSLELSTDFNDSYTPIFTYCLSGGSVLEDKPLQVKRVIVPTVLASLRGADLDFEHHCDGFICEEQSIDEVYNWLYRTDILGVEALLTEYFKVSPNYSLLINKLRENVDLIAYMNPYLFVRSVGREIDKAYKDGRAVDIFALRNILEKYEKRQSIKDCFKLPILRTDIGYDLTQEYEKGLDEVRRALTVEARKRKSIDMSLLDSIFNQIVRLAITER